jgi:carbon starvation protein
MSLLPIILCSAVILTIAYFTYGRMVARLLRLDPNKPTPAVEMRDGLDYEPIDSKFLMSQHFSAIAAAGPIVGPIAAGLAFGWVPALIWILVGSIFIGGVHDMAALTASVRHKAGSIAEVVRLHMSRRSFLLFLSFVWIALVYIIVAFTDVTTTAFVGMQDLGAGVTVTGGAIASSSLLYLVLPIVMGLLLRYTKLSLNMATLIFLPLIAGTIYVGKYIPFDVQALTGLSKTNAQNVWDVALLIYCLVAAVVPVWLLLQPRGHLGGYFLYIALGGGVVGLLIGNHEIKYPEFTTWTTGQGATLVPFLFIMIACGACSGFHSLIASGTTSKQLKRETDARVIGYGAMLLEAMVAIVSLSCVMIWAKGSTQLNSSPNVIYAQGMGAFLKTMNVPPEFAISFALMAFTTFVYDTLDVCTRLGRYIIQELTGWQDAKGRWLGTILTSGVPLYFLLQTPPTDANGVEQPLYKLFWNLFGASNQLLAALTLLGVTVWLWRTRREAWVWLVTGLPCVFMYVMSSWALVAMTWPKFVDEKTREYIVPKDPVPWIGLVLLVLAALMLVEAVIALAGDRRPPRPGLALQSAPAAGS